MYCSEQFNRGGGAGEQLLPQRIAPPLPKDTSGGAVKTYYRAA